MINNEVEVTTEATTEATTEEIKEWKISDIVTNTSPDDNTTNESTIYKTDVVYFHFDIIDGPSDEGLQLLVKESNRAINIRQGEADTEFLFEGKNVVGDNCWYQSYCYNTETG